MTFCTCGAGHKTFGACMRAKNIRVGYCRSASNLDYTAEKRNTRELSAYKAARDQKVQPAGTGLYQTQTALEVSDRMGRPFDASNLTSNFLE